MSPKQPQAGAAASSSTKEGATAGSPKLSPAAILNHAYVELLDWDNDNVFPEVRKTETSYQHFLDFIFKEDIAMQKILFSILKLLKINLFSDISIGCGEIHWITGQTSEVDFDILYHASDIQHCRCRHCWHF